MIKFSSKYLNTFLLHTLVVGFNQTNSNQGTLKFGICASRFMRLRAVESGIKTTKFNPYSGNLFSPSQSPKRTSHGYWKVVSSTDQTESREERKADSKPLVLIVDDNPDYAKLFDLLSDQLGITTRIVNSCDDAMKAMEKNKFDLVIMDWLMPEVDGPACARKIRLSEGRGNHITIVGVSGYDGASREACLQSGMDDYLSIPFTLDALHEKLSSWLRTRQPGA